MRVTPYVCSIAALALGLAGTASAQQSEEQLRNEVEALKKRDEEKNKQIEELRESIRKLQLQMGSNGDAQLHSADSAALSQEVEKYNHKVEHELPITDRFNNPLSDSIKNLVFSMQARTRAEYVDNLTDFSHHRDDETLFGSYRFRLGVGAGVTDDLDVYFEAQSTGFAGDEPPGTANSNTGNDFTPYQGFVKWKNFVDDPDSYLKIGRQEMLYGSEFLVGDRDFGTGQSFDGIRLGRDSKDYEVSVWATRIVDNEFPAIGTPAGSADENVNFYGAYFTLKTLEAANLDLYWMWLQDHDSTPNPLTGRAEDDRHTFGARISSEFGDGFDYNAEFAIQAGSGKANDGTHTNINHANGLEAGLGYTFKDSDMKPRIGVMYARASGDNNPNDSNDESFNSLFQDNHGRYGNADLFTFTNLQVLGAKGSFVVPDLEKWSFGAGYYYFIADEANDVSGPLSVSAGAPGSRSIGQEVDLFADYAVAKHVTLGVNYSHFFTQHYIDNQINETSDAADRLYVNFDIHF
jgi:alginate export protein